MGEFSSVPWCDVSCRVERVQRDEQPRNRAQHRVRLLRAHRAPVRQAGTTDFDSETSGAA